MEALDLSDSGLSEALRTIATALENRQQKVLPTGFQHRRRAAIERLLEDKAADTRLLDYNLDGAHAGLVMTSPHLAAPLRHLRRRLACRLLTIESSDDTAWIWLGGNRKSVEGDLGALDHLEFPEEATIACGEPAEGLEGWRLTHQQALACLSIARLSTASVVRYRDVAFLAAALHDDLLAASLRQSYLVPLEEDRDRGATAKETLRAYFRTGRNASSAAAALGVNRGTIRNRLETIEARLRRPLNAISAELEIALRVDEVLASSVMGSEP